MVNCIFLRSQEPEEEEEGVARVADGGKTLVKDGVRYRVGDYVLLQADTLVWALYGLVTATILISYRL